MSKEEAINKLYATIKSKFESDGIMHDLRCILQAKMVEIMKGKTEGKLTSRHHHSSHMARISNGHEMLKPLTTGDVAPTTASNIQTDSTTTPRDIRIQMLHLLILDYLYWHGFEYTAEMFAFESTTANTKPTREYLETHLGTVFKYKTLPILLELVSDLME